VRSHDDLLVRTLAFSGSYVSDDGNVTIRRSPGSSFEYSGDRFVGNCRPCLGAHLIPPTGAALPDADAVARFMATHSHGDID
jgi:hypothetical protein